MRQWDWVSAVVLSFGAVVADAAIIADLPVRDGSFSGTIRIETRSDAQPRGQETVDIDPAGVRVQSRYGTLDGTLEWNKATSPTWQVSASSSVRIVGRPPLDEYIQPYGYLVSSEGEVSRRFQATLSESGRNAGFEDITGIWLQPVVRRQTSTSLEPRPWDFGRSPVATYHELGGYKQYRTSSGAGNWTEIDTLQKVFVPLGREVVHTIGAAVTSEGSGQSPATFVSTNVRVEYELLGITGLHASDGRMMEIDHLQLTDLDTGAPFTWAVVPEPSLLAGMSIVVLGGTLRRQRRGSIQAR